MMNVAILRCDDVLEKFQPQFGHYPEMIRQMLQLPDHRFDFTDFDCQLGDFPEDLDGYDFYITTGSKTGVYEDKPWIRQLIHFVRQLDRQRKKLIGICFGHQVMAMACHGKVEKSNRGWGIGVAANRVVATPDWMQETKPDLNILVSHQDQITALPKGALVIAESNFCPYFMVQWNDHFLSIQGHPEWTNAYARALINERKAIIDPKRIAIGLASLTIEPDNRLCARWIMNFITRHTPSPEGVHATTT